MDHRSAANGRRGTQRLRQVALAAASLSVLSVACGTNPRVEIPSQTSTAARQPVNNTESPSAQPAGDPIAAVISVAERLYEQGERELKQGHLARAKVAFDAAVDALLEFPYGARSDERLRGYFDRLVDRITAHEMLELARGDGFTEQRYEPATIDELLAASLFEPPAPTPELQKAVEANFERAMPDVPIPLNKKVLSYVELFQGRLRDWLQDGLSRGARYLPMIQEAFRAEGLPLDLAYVPLIESAFKPHALSRAKAKGVWQFMAGTGREHGLKQDWYIDERSDTEKATLAAATYLRTLYELFNGDWHLALASYNGGPGRLQGAMKRTRLGDFWSIAAKSWALPRETREYVPMILAAIIIAKNPAEFGFSLATTAPLRYEKVPLDRPVDLRRIAEWTGVTIEEIQELNPELRRWTTPVKYPGYEIKVPPGTADQLRARLEQADPAEVTALNWYTVRRGESLSSIAQKLRVRRDDLAAANYLSVRAGVMAGQELVVPRPPAIGLAARAEGPEPPATLASRTLSDAAADDTEVNSGERLVYRVKRGDTLSSIARTFRVTVSLLKSWNNLRTDRITAGDRLTIFSVLSSAAAEP